MNGLMRTGLILALILALGPVPVTLAAQPDADDGAARGGYPSLDAAVSAVESETGGRVLSAERVREGDRTVYRIKLLTPEGRVRVIHAEAQ